MNRPILHKWLEYVKTLREDLPLQTINEARDAFYAGVIAGRSIMETSHGAAAEDLVAECREYLEMLEERVRKAEQK
jgi:hypothetical protein